MPLNLYLPKTVYEDIKKVYPSIDFFIEVKKCANLILMQEGQEVMIHNMTVQAIGYTQDDPHWFAYLFSQNDKSLLYLPCDTIGFTRALPPVDVLVHECWIFSPEVKDELSFEQMLVRIKKAAPWKVIVTHIEEIELARYPERFEALEQEYQDINLFLGYDGMEIQL